MERFSTWRIEQAPAIKLIGKIEIPLSLADQDRHRSEWRQACEKNPKLYNSPILIMGEWEVDALSLGFVDYASAYLRARDSYWRQKFQFITLGVSGMTLFQDKCLVGRRASWVGSYAEKEELVPSGGVGLLAETSHWAENHVLQELKEEAQISSASVEAVKPLCMILDKKERCFEVCFEIRLRKEVPLPPRGPDDEYSKLWWEEADQLRKRWKKEPKQAVPISYLLLRDFLL